MSARILVVEDDQYFAGVLRDYLQWLGLEVQLAAHGLEAWELLQQQLPEAVLCDILLPRLDGTELCRRVRGLHEGLPFVLMSAVYKTAPQIEDLIQETGASAFLPKPVSIESLRRTLEPHLPLRTEGEADCTDHGDDELAVHRLGPGSTVERSGRVEPGFLPSLLLRLRAVGHSGVLELRDEARWKRIVFDGGRPSWADGSSTHDRMGTMLLEEGTISAEDFEAAVQAMRDEGIDFGTSLTRLGLLSHTELYEQLSRLVKRRVISAFSWGFGEWKLDEEVPRQTSHFESALLPLIWRGLLAHGDVRALRRDLAGYRDRYVVPTPRLALDWPELRDTEGIGFLGSFLSGRRTLDDLEEMEILDPDDLTRALWMLFHGGLVGFATSPAERPEQSPNTGDVDAVEAPKTLTEFGERVISDYLRLWQADFFAIFGLLPDASDEQLAEALEVQPLGWAGAELPESMPSTLRRKAQALVSWVEEARQTLQDPRRRAEYQERLAEGLTGVYRKVGGPQEAEAAMFFELGRAFMQNRNFREAELSFGKAVDRVPDNAEYKAYRGWALYRRDGDAKERAGALVGEALRLDPHLAIAHYFEGMILRDRRHHAEAAAKFEAALEFDPRFEPARKALAQTRQLVADA